MAEEYDSGELKIMRMKKHDKHDIAVINRKAYIVGRRNSLHSSYHPKAKEVMRGK